MTYLGMRYYVEIYTIVHILWGQAWKKSFSGKKRKLLTFHVQYLWRVVHYDITVTWPEVQNGGPRAAGSQVSMIHNFLILYPILLKFSLGCLNKVQLYYKSDFPLGLHSPLRKLVECQFLVKISLLTFVTIIYTKKCGIRCNFLCILLFWEFLMYFFVFLTFFGFYYFFEETY